MKSSKKILASAIATLAVLASCTEPKVAGGNASGLNPELFSDTIDGKVTALYTLTNANGMEVCITNFGGRVVSIMAPDRDGNLKDVVLGYDNVAQYADRMKSPSDYGASIGRYANRISKHSFTIGEETFELVPNDGDNCLHGGPTGWQYQVYDAEQIDDQTLKLTIVSPDGDNGFPGEVTAITTYKLTEDNTLDITWEATTTKETVINQTNHCYFNLNGDPTRVGTNMELYVNADNYTPSDVYYIPTGEILPVEGTPFDFRTPKALSEVVNDTTFEQIKNATGVDHNFCLNTYDQATGKGDDTQVCASLYSPETGIFLEVYTNEPGIQVYTGNFQGVGRDAEIVRKHGMKYPKHVSVCLESQKYPDSPNKAGENWPSANLKPGEKYYSHCAYKFSTK
ncbi:MAG: galactose mutarotase [Bacteroidaceae bacterium]|nr:galactose mutarotase [Bacteroidaceae bacterium]